MIRWPKTKRDLVGRKLRAIRVVETQVAVYPVGGVYRVVTASTGSLWLHGPRCEACKVQPIVRIRMNAGETADGFELLEEGGDARPVEPIRPEFTVLRRSETAQGRIAIWTGTYAEVLNSLDDLHVVAFNDWSAVSGVGDVFEIDDVLTGGHVVRIMPAERS